ncbi:hypothetical protein ABE28_009805 [Peribacillus muralis]|uniref:Uncharacterized protein n=1 Tax=Peribacillus muralis TaxID=264697 RepID=A0A1B3XN57_9BACI|nr:hypothetical protein ABE28_009805 [Peribacillus muralis]
MYEPPLIYCKQLIITIIKYIPIFINGNIHIQMERVAFEVKVYKSGNKNTPQKMYVRWLPFTGQFKFVYSLIYILTGKFYMLTK